MAWIERILVPLDLHHLGETKIPVASAQAQAFDAELILMHVCLTERVLDGRVSTAEAQAQTYLDAFTARLRADGIKARPLIQWGRVAETILSEIETQHIDLVVMGTNTRHGLSELLLGSIATVVIARASCPVLLVQPLDAQALPPPAVRNFTEDAARAGRVAPRDLGLRTVDVARIIGSVGRADDLDAGFRSRQQRREAQQRFERILHLMEQGAPLPPVSLYKLGYGYYVLDGNHRVAAAKHLGQLDIDAVVTEFMPLGDSQAQRVAMDRRTFEQTTGLRRLGSVVPGNYLRLEDMIRAYAAEQGLDDLREAAQWWEARVYNPVAKKLRARRMQQHFPGERTADVFLRVASVRDEAVRTTGQLLDWDEALERLQ